MQEKCAYLISCSDHYSHRLNVIADHLRQREYQVTYVTSNFDHIKKAQFVCKVSGAVQIPAKPYKKNLSLDRILSHRNFARDVFRYLEELPREPDVVVALLPPNFLAHYAAKYKKAHPNVKLIFDVFDLWPETFPSGRAKTLLAPVFGVWGMLRDRNLDAADFVITECELFRRKLRLHRHNSAAVYLCAEPMESQVLPQLREEEISLCYLGSVNNVVDIPRICAFVGQLKQYKPVTLHIIGVGERMQEMIAGTEAAGASVVFHGAVYDPGRKQEIMAGCHFGLNVMKTTTCIGLTMKSLDYLQMGLPIINTVPADTQMLVQLDKIGLMLDGDCAEIISNMTLDDYLQMRQNVKRIFEERFTRSVIDTQYKEILDKIL